MKRAWADTPAGKFVIESKVPGSCPYGGASLGYEKPEEFVCIIADFIHNLRI